jgi:hypothetical protein
MPNVLPPAIAGMNAATRRLQSAAVKIANGPKAGGELEQSFVDLVMSRLHFAANAKVVEVNAQTLRYLLDIKT